MNIEQLLGDHFNNDTVGFEAKMANQYHALPGVIESVDFVTMTCTVQPAIQGIWYKPDQYNINTANNVNMPLLIFCPIIFPTGGGVTMTFPLVRGDECLVIISSRCVDSWWQLGGMDTDGNIIPRPQLEYRMNDLSDGFVLPGPFSQPRVIPNISTVSTQIRSNDGLNFLELNPTTKEINIITATTGSVNITTPNTNITSDVLITGNLHISGNIQCDQTITATTDVIGNGTSLHGHTHSGVQSGSSNTGAPN